jgi:hypothetical protein
MTGIGYLAWLAIFELLHSLIRPTTLDVAWPACARAETDGSCPRVETPAPACLSKRTQKKEGPPVPLSSSSRSIP